MKECNDFAEAAKRYPVDQSATMPCTCGNGEFRLGQMNCHFCGRPWWGVLPSWAQGPEPMDCICGRGQVQPGDYGCDECGRLWAVSVALRMRQAVA